MIVQLGDRFAELDEVRSAGTKIDLENASPNGAGLPLMSDGRTVYVCSDDSHSLIIGGSGSKKNRLFIFTLIHLLAKNGENMCIYDPKGENLARTGTYVKSHGYRIITLDFRHVGKRGDFWNPLYYAYKLYKQGENDKAQELFADFINAIAESQRKNTNDVFWPDSAASLATGIVLALAECAEPEEMNVASFARMCCQDNMDKIEYLAEKIPHDSIAGINLSGIKTSPEKTKQSIYISLFSMISMFINQTNLVTALSNSTFDMTDIADKKTAIYIITPDERSTYNFVVSLFVKQMYEVLIAAAQENKDHKLKIRMNYILDEFCNIPQIPDFTNMISAARSRNIRYFLVTQGLKQLQSKYGADDAQTIIGNCSNIAFLHSREQELLDMLSRMAGEIYLSDGSKRPLITPSQLQRLNKDKGEVLIFTGRLHPYVTQLPNIDAYDMFKNDVQMESLPSNPKKPKIISLYRVIREIENKDRPVPFLNFDKDGNEDTDKNTKNSPVIEYEEDIWKKYETLFGDG